MFFLGIETSCDETAASVIEAEPASFRVVTEEISSQVKLHEEYGGVVPELASREHLANLPLIVDQVMKGAGLTFGELSAIGVTRGPGLKGCLLMGLNFAKGICLASNIPLIGVNHIEGHIHSARVDNAELSFPFLALVVSGGHTEIVLVRGTGKYELFCRTIDDAAGEAFDKSANLLGFRYPGGASLAKAADQFGKSSIKLPRVMMKKEGFSFSGLKTAIATLIRQKREELAGNPKVKDDICAAVQESIVEALTTKLEEAIRVSGAKYVSVTGGVSANLALRKRVSEIKGIRAFFPGLNHCMDNASMIAWVAAERFIAGQRDPLDLPVMSRWPVEEMSI